MSTPKLSKQVKQIAITAHVVNCIWETLVNKALPVGLEEHVFRRIADAQRRLGVLSPKQYATLTADAVDVFLKNRLDVEQYEQWVLRHRAP